MMHESLIESSSSGIQIGGSFECVLIKSIVFDQVFTKSVEFKT